MREPDRIIRLKTVLSRTGLSRSTIYRKIAEGTFPAQLKISTNGSGWHESDINRWINDPSHGVRSANSMRSESHETGGSMSLCWRRAWDQTGVSPSRPPRFAVAPPRQPVCRTCPTAWG